VIVAGQSNASASGGREGVAWAVNRHSAASETALMPGSEFQILSDAIARNSALVLSLPSAGLARNYKSRFLGDHAEGFWVEAPSGEKPLIDELLTTGKPVGIAFRSGPNKVLFTVPIKCHDPAMVVNSQTRLDAILLATPAEIKTIQRRANYRVGITAETEVTARMWRIPEHAYLNDRPSAAQELRSELRDISLGGIGVILRSRDGGEPKVVPGQRVRIEMKYSEVTLLLDGRVRQPTGTDATDGIRTGIAFKPLDNQLEGRQKLAQLARIVSDLQRDEVKRMRRTAG
jgi:c-di-GMP-binding flagellar brake protein YcgR